MFNSLLVKKCETHLVWVAGKNNLAFSSLPAMLASYNSLTIIVLVAV
jgi:hypothetical protein